MSLHPIRFGYLAMDPLVSSRDLVARASRARELGFTTFQVRDHFDRSPMIPSVSLATVAAGVEDLRIGTLVLGDDSLHPALLAKELSTLDC